MVATSIALAALAAGAASAGGAAIQAHAAGSAAKTQAASADKALALNRDIYNDQVKRVSPYLDIGTQSLARLYNQKFGSPMTSQVSDQLAPFAGAIGMPPGMSLGSMGRPTGGPMPTASMSGPSTSGPSPMGPGAGGGTVRLRAPNGQEQDVPADLADQFIARGAQRVA